MDFQQKKYVETQKKHTGIFGNMSKFSTYFQKFWFNFETFDTNFVLFWTVKKSIFEKSCQQSKDTGIFDIFFSQKAAHFPKIIPNSETLTGTHGLRKNTRMKC